MNRSAGAKLSSQAAMGDAGRREPCARCSGTGQQCLKYGGLQPDPPCPGNHGAACSGLLSGQQGTIHASGCLVPSAPAWQAGEAVARGQKQPWFFLSDLDVREKPWRGLCLCSCEALGSRVRVKDMLLPCLCDWKIPAVLVWW